LLSNFWRVWFSLAIITLPAVYEEICADVWEVVRPAIPWIASMMLLSNVATTPIKTKCRTTRYEEP
jgi:hypothetical protein